ncbi:unnamed protein product [Periconia digitata]|uniref:Uncharacterized protein n=1 Tax=Periconia digitata TaxID=1303443 RepID=A0A9W4U4A8_9PLEO|nr:unnamed protein product [Periconia digitata]
MSDIELTTEKVKCLQDENYIRPSQTAGKRKVSSSFLSPPPSSASATYSSSPSASISFRSRGESASDWVEFPESCESVAALEHVGFETNTAVQIFQRFRDRMNAHESPNTPFDFVQDS